MQELLNKSIEELVGTSFKCECGKVHTVSLENVIIKESAIDELPVLFKNIKNILIVADNNTYNIAGKHLNELLKNRNTSTFVFPEEHLHPDINALGRILLEIEKETELIIALGSGTINDISRMISYKLDIPYIIVATAPSMDGYASTVSPIITDGIKSTYNAVYPKCVIADLNILKNAPFNMIRAGIGDIIGKYTALADWKISKILNNEYYCDSIAEVVSHSLKKCIKECKDVEKLNISAIKSLTEILIFSGLAIGMTGSSRPASGEEHHLCHCWESYFLEKGEMPKWLHGNYVAVGTCIVIEAYKFFLQLDLDDIYSKGKWKNFNYNIWSGNIKNMYKTNADFIINLKKPFIDFDEKKRKDNFLNILKNEVKLRAVIETLLDDTKNLKKQVAKSKILYSPVDVGIDKETFINSFIAAKDIRTRYGIFQLLEDVGMLSEAADKISCLYYL